MMRFVWVAMVVAVVGCDRPSKKPAAKAAACLADELPTLHLGWKVLDCPPENTRCHTTCFDGDGDACMSRAFAVEMKRDQEAHRLFKQACKLGWSLGCVNYAAGLWAYGGATEACTMKLFEKACEAEDSFGCGMVARMLIEQNTPEGRARGKRQLEQACAKFQGPPCRFLAFYLERGELGPAPPRAELERLMKAACDGRDEVACGEWEKVSDTFHD